MANPVAEFNDSQVGIVLGTALHTLGAIAFLGGLVGYLAWHRHLAQGHHHRKVLDGAAVLTYIAIVANLLGGFMRTFESDHPHLTAFADSAWVRAIAIKHVFIFVGMGAAVYLFEAVAPRLVAAHKQGTLADAKPPGHRIGVLLVALGILVSAVLGAITQVVPPVEASGDADAMDHDEHPAESVRYANATGQLTSTPVAPTTATGGFDVLEGTTVMEATFLWAPATSPLSADLKGPDGTVVTLSSDSRRAEATIPTPQHGSWTYTVRADFAVGVTWSLSVRMASAAGGETLMADRVTIAPGQFFEINTLADRDDTLHWSWSSDAAVHFDVHTHFDDQVQYAVSEETAGSSGSYTAVRNGGHSYLWENTGTLPVALDYRAWGPWELDSTFPPA